MTQVLCSRRALCIHFKWTAIFLCINYKHLNSVCHFAWLIVMATEVVDSPVEETVPSLVREEEPVPSKSDAATDRAEGEKLATKLGIPNDDLAQ